MLLWTHWWKDYNIEITMLKSDQFNASLLNKTCVHLYHSIKDTIWHCANFLPNCNGGWPFEHISIQMSSFTLQTGTLIMPESVRIRWIQVCWICDPFVSCSPANMASRQRHLHCFSADSRNSPHSCLSVSSP